MSGRHEQSEGLVFGGEIHVLRYGSQEKHKHGASISQGLGLVCEFLLKKTIEGRKHVNALHIIHRAQLGKNDKIECLEQMCEESKLFG